MPLSPSAHADTFARDHLPPEDQWPPFEFTLPELQFPDRLNAAEVLLDQTIATHGAERPAVLTPDGLRWTYGELRQRADQIAHVLVDDRGVVPGNRVMLRSPNNPWTVAAWLGALKAGAVVVTTMHALREQEVAELVRLTTPTVALADHRFAEEMHAAAQQHDGVTVVEYGGPAADDLALQCATKPAEFAAVETAADDVALLAPTSGSTGVPKVTMHFHRDILAIAETFARHLLDPQPSDVFAGSAPLAFTFGLGALVVFPLRFGASMLLTERATPVEFAQHVHDAGATVISTAPTAYRAIVREGRADLLSGVRAAVSAGEPLPKETSDDVHDTTGLRIIDGIGSTEMLHIFISAAGNDIRPGATGVAVPGYRATILDDDGNEVGVGQSGRLAVVGPTGCRYLADDRQQVYVAHDWNLTGDTYVRDDEGYFFFRSRTDNLIVSSGYNIAGPEVEAAVASHEDVVEVAVVGRPDWERGNVVVAFVVLREGVEGDDTTRKAIQDHVKARIAPYKYPRDIRFVDALPRNPSGKLQHFKLRGQLADEVRAGTTTPNATARRAVKETS